jgi:hypothetical protein
MLLWSSAKLKLFDKLRKREGQNEKWQELPKITQTNKQGQRSQTKGQG